MDRLWTPWRYQYIKTAAQHQGCVLCDAWQTSEDERLFILHRGAACFLILNLYPYTTGHLMVVTNRHVADLPSASPEEAHELMMLARLAQLALARVYHPEGFNLGMNMGVCAGAGVGGHLHFHVLPRWIGDTNFMTVTAETRILPEALSDTYAKLLPFFNPTSNLI
jgi:ATP adenylyltransferase